MFELAGTHFAKGTLELDLEKMPPRWMAWILRFGLVRGRMLVLSLIAAGFFLAYTQQPGRWLLGQGFFSNQVVYGIQKTLEWGFVSVAGFLWLVVILRRPESLNLVFDRTKSEFRFVHTPGGRHAQAQEGTFPMATIQAIRVFGPEREPRTPHGFVEIALGAGLPEPYQAFRFRLLSEEQLKIYPTNLARMTGKAAEGDWTDPDDAPVGT